MFKVRTRHAGMSRFGRMLAMLVLVFAVALPMMPTASAQAASVQAQTESAANSGTWYRVKSGDTLGELARYYGTTVNAIMRANNLSTSRIYVGQSLFIPSATVAASCKATYIVVKGDNLSRIARAYGINVYSLAAANGLSNASLIVPGQRLCIPNIWATTPSPAPGGGCYYTVQQGDNLSRIASWYGTTVAHLAHVNHISNTRLIIPGQRLYVC